MKNAHKWPMKHYFLNKLDMFIPIRLMMAVMSPCSATVGKGVAEIEASYALCLDHRNCLTEGIGQFNHLVKKTSFLL